MAAKIIAILIPLFTILLGAPIGSSSRLYETTTTTTTTTVEAKNPFSCRLVPELNACQRYLRDSSRLQLQTAPGKEEESSGTWREEFPRCCEELQSTVARPCWCVAVNNVVERLRRQQGEYLQGQEMREMSKTAAHLPSLCRLGDFECYIKSDHASATWF